MSEIGKNVNVIFLYLRLQQNICCRMEQIYDIEERVSETIYCNLSRILTKLVGQEIECRGLKIDHGKKDMVDGIITIEVKSGSDKEEELLTWMDYIQETIKNHKEINKWTIGGNNVEAGSGNLCETGTGYVREDVIDGTLTEANKKSESLHMERVPDTHWIYSVWKEENTGKEYELEYSIGVKWEEDGTQEWKKKWIDEYKDHERFVREELYQENIEDLEEKEESEGETECKPYILDVENGGQDIFLTARVLYENMRSEEETEAACKIQRWFRAISGKSINEEKKYKIIMDTMTVSDEKILLMILMNKENGSAYIIMLAGEDEQGMKEGLKRVFTLEGVPEEITITKTKELLYEREEFCEENDIKYKSEQLININGKHNTNKIREQIAEAMVEAEKEEKTLEETIVMMTKRISELLIEQEIREEVEEQTSMEGVSIENEEETITEEMNVNQ